MLPVAFKCKIAGTSNSKRFFTQSIGTYSELQNDSVLGGSLSRPVDDEIFEQINLGFRLYFNGIVHTRVAISANGFLTFGGEDNILGSLGNAFVSVTDPTGIVLTTADPNQNNQLVAGLNLDLLALSNNQAESKISIGRAGRAPNRTFTVQWKNFERFSTRIAGDTFNFQIVLKEKGAAEVVFGKMILSSQEELLAQTGVRLQTSRDVLALVGNANAALQTSPLATSKVCYAANMVPPMGKTLVFAFRQRTGSDAYLTKMIFRAGVLQGCGGEQFTPVQFVVKNVGLETIDTLDLSYQTSNGKVGSKLIQVLPTLQSGETRNFILDGNDGADVRENGKITVNGFVNTPRDTALYNNGAAKESLFNKSTSLSNLALDGQIHYQTSKLGFKMASEDPAARDTATSMRMAGGIGPLQISVDSLFRGRKVDYFYKSGLLVEHEMKFKFDASISEYANSPFSIDNRRLGDDTVKFAISRDCGASWITLFKIFKTPAVSRLG